ncbi:peptidase domain-containing ABC transporter [Rudanella lutea]|uniref:peptidase domain-containing ABC transporter n=1 Tax=Rudanella lutea TaxID=451374 RepID=UPI00035D2ED3|nr:peptidase domain-containing ABC transporter [Rudanella lutea]
MRFVVTRQYDEADCGPTCLLMVARHYGQTLPRPWLRQLAGQYRGGVSLRSLTVAAQKLGFETRTMQLRWSAFREAPLPAIVYLPQRQHFVVVYALTPTHVHVADPALGRVQIPTADFCAQWATDEQPDPTGTALFLSPTHAFYALKPPKPAHPLTQLWQARRYLRQHPKLLLSLLVVLSILAAIQAVLPGLSQRIVDEAVQPRRADMLRWFLVSQLGLTAGLLVGSWTQSWLLTQLSNRLSFAILNDFLRKLLRLPLAFFDQKRFGDITQRIADHERVDQFLSQFGVQLVTLAVAVLINGGLLFHYSPAAFGLFVGGTALHLIWTFGFMRHRVTLDQELFSTAAQSQSRTLELLEGIPDVKLANAEEQIRTAWLGVQRQRYQLRLRAQKLAVGQSGGASVLFLLTNLLISYVVASSVIAGGTSLGVLLAVQVVVGQLATPLSQAVFLVQQAQDTQLALARIGELHEEPDERAGHGSTSPGPPATLRLERVWFAYPGTEEAVLRNISLTIPVGKTTAIVGASGSGKTTLLQLLLGTHDPTHGRIWLGKSHLLADANPTDWRQRCGVVWQTGYIFSDTIAANVALGDPAPEPARVWQALQTAALASFVAELPLRIQTRVGNEGLGLSQGQRQRLLIARAVYKNPDYLFFDEATNALDTATERQIIDNLNQFGQGRTVVVVAHRLSTVRQADQIVVLQAGQIAEQGTHESLLANRKLYWQLVHNQLELNTPVPNLVV